MLYWAPQDSCLRFLVFLNPFRKWSPKTWAQHCVCGPQQLYRCTHCTPPRITAHGPWRVIGKKKKNEKNALPSRSAIIKKSKKERNVQVEIRRGSTWSRRWAQEGALGQRPGGFRRGAAGRRRLRKQNAGRAPPEVEERRTGNLIKLLCFKLFSEASTDRRNRNSRRALDVC